MTVKLMLSGVLVGNSIGLPENREVYSIFSITFRQKNLTRSWFLS